MQFLAKKFPLLGLLLFLFIFFLLPVDQVKAVEYGCIIRGQCTKMDAPDVNIARSTCTDLCRVGDPGKFCVLQGPCPQTSAPAAASASGCQIVAGKEVCTLPNPLQRCTVDSSGQKTCKDITSATDVIGVVITAALGVIGGFALLMFVWGGFEWLTSAGNQEKVKSGTQTMVWAAIGVVLVLGSYLLLSTFLNFLTGNA